VAWAGIPHVTQGDEADVTDLEAARRRRNDAAGDDEAKITLTAIAVRVAAAALRRFPDVNASLDPAGNEAIVKRYVHVGVAVDTERGLLVPVIRDADDKSVAEIAEELDELAERAREGGLGAEEMRGACFTVTNLGGLGTTWFSPIVNWPEAAILGIGRADRRAVVASDEVHARLILPLSLSYDHRLIDGAGAARFLRAIASGLEQPWLLALGNG
jgi:pyruvate dehydrogenase E2 component (dihydrolipoamide acetyltransferase)